MNTELKLKSIELSLVAKPSYEWPRERWIIILNIRSKVKIVGKNEPLSLLRITSVS